MTTPNKNTTSQATYLGADGKEYRWYDLNIALSRNPAFFFDIGARGIGKTTSWLLWARRSWEATGERWAVVVRRRDEIEGISEIVKKYRVDYFYLLYCFLHSFADDFEDFVAHFKRIQQVRRVYVQNKEREDHALLVCVYYPAGLGALRANSARFF